MKVRMPSAPAKKASVYLQSNSGEARTRLRSSLRAIPTNASKPTKQKLAHKIALLGGKKNAASGFDPLMNKAK
ncbi:MAG: hypothetical protein RIE58_01420 [Vicingaceae bacterium]